MSDWNTPTLMFQKHQQNMVEVRVAFWGHGLGDDPDGVQPGHIWASGLVATKANTAHSVSDSEVRPFESYDELAHVIAGLLQEQGLAVFEGNPAQERPKRVFGRLVPEGISCSLGRVMNVSAGGVMLETSKVPSDDTSVVFVLPDKSKLTFVVSPRWSRKTGIKKHQVGLEFVNATKSDIARLMSAPLETSVKRVI